MLIGLGGRRGSTPGLFVGMGFGSGCILLFTCENDYLCNLENIDAI